MARARNIKPATMENEDLAALPCETRLLFIYLWMLADREGRLEDRPKRIRAQAFPYDTDFDVDRMLSDLEASDFIIRYAVGGQAFIQITNFTKHQRPHSNETCSEIPPIEQADPPEEEVVSPEPEIASYHGEQSLRPIGEALCPDLLIEDSLIPDSLIPDTLTVSAPASQGAAPKKRTIPPAPTADTWNAYASAYRQQYSVEPVRNATVNGQLANFVKRLGADEAPAVAAFYVWHNNRYYAQQMHSVAAMVKDAEKLRTEWATGNRMTATIADQVDKTQTNGDVFGKLIREAQDAQRRANP
ncbi:hypothetical protein [Cupriavidus necator]